MAKIVTLKDNDDKQSVYPISSTTAIYRPDNTTTVESILDKSVIANFGNTISNGKEIMPTLNGFTSDDFIKVTEGFKIVEHGTDNGWNWFKYNNGISFCFGEYPLTTSVKEAHGPKLYLSEKYAVKGYPENLFIKSPICLFNISSASNFAGYTYWYETTPGTKSRTSNVWIATTWPQSPISTFNVGYFAIGQWK